MSSVARGKGQESKVSRETGDYEINASASEIMPGCTFNDFFFGYPKMDQVEPVRINTAAAVIYQSSGAAGAIKFLER